MRQNTANYSPKAVSDTPCDERPSYLLVVGVNAILQVGYGGSDNFRVDSLKQYGDSLLACHGRGRGKGMCTDLYRNVMKILIYFI